MKHLLIIAIAFVTLQTTAQEGRKYQKQDHAEMMKSLTPQERATINTKRMTVDLDLNDKQQAQVHEILLAQAIERQKTMEERQKEKADAKMTQSKEAYVKHLNQKLDDQIEIKAQMKAILTPEQYQKWEVTLSEKRKKDKQMHKRKPRG